MIKTFKWIYSLGVRAERKRFEQLVLEHYTKKPRQDDAVYHKKEFGPSTSLVPRIYEKDLEVWHRVQEELDGALYPENMKLREQMTKEILG